MNRRLFAFFVFAVMLFAAVAAVTEEKKPFTADRHKAVNIGCKGCHAEDPPKTAASEKSCLSCHKSMEAVAERTVDYEKNPHKNHLTESNDIACTQCHLGHKADVIICQDCHGGMTFEKREN